MKIFKKSLAAFLVILMLLTSAPLQGFVGLDISLPDFFSNEAKAIGVPGYSAGAAVKWALDHYNDIDSILTGKGYWSEEVSTTEPETEESTTAIPDENIENPSEESTNIEENSTENTEENSSVA